MGGKKSKPTEKPEDKRLSEARIVMEVELFAWADSISPRGVDYKLIKAVKAYRLAMKICDDEHG